MVASDTTQEESVTIKEYDLHVESRSKSSSSLSSRTMFSSSHSSLSSPESMSTSTALSLHENRKKTSRFAQVLSALDYTRLLSSHGFGGCPGWMACELTEPAVGTYRAYVGAYHHPGAYCFAEDPATSPGYLRSRLRSSLDNCRRRPRPN